MLIRERLGLIRTLAGVLEKLFSENIRLEKHSLHESDKSTQTTVM